MGYTTGRSSKRLHRLVIATVALLALGGLLMVQPTSAEIPRSVIETVLSHDQPQAVHVSLTAKHETDRRGHVSEMDVSDRRGLRVGTMEAAVIAEIEA